MKKTMFLLLALAMGYAVQAQEKVTVGTEESEHIYAIVEEEPMFPGGLEKLYQYIGENLQYPAEAKEKKVSGIVYVSFVVEKDGSISNPRVLRGIGAGCDEEALRVVKAMPKWKPGRQRGKNVRVQFNLPFRFTLD